MGASSTSVANVSEISIVSYSLQKLLVFFMILDAAWMVLGYSFLGPLLSFLFHFLVLQGVKRGRTSILMIYVVLNVIVLSLAAMGALFALGAVMTAEPMDYSSSSSEYIQPGLQQVPTAQTLIRRIATTIAPSPVPQIDIASDSNSNSASASSSSSSMYDSSSEIEADNMLLAGSIFLVISVIVLYCKIYSVVLAARLRRLLLASPVLPVHVILPVDGVQEPSDSESGEKPLLQQQEQYVPVHYAPLSAEDNVYAQQPGFPVQPQLYYPSMQGAPSMMPPPFMYGQHPVFYTFAPASPSNEKQ